MRRQLQTATQPGVMPTPSHTPLHHEYRVGVGDVGLTRCARLPHRGMSGKSAGRRLSCAPVGEVTLQVNI